MLVTKQTRAPLTGYARSSRADPPIDEQIAALHAAGVDESNVFIEHLDGSDSDQPQLKKAMSQAGKAHSPLIVYHLGALGTTAKGVMRTLYALRHHRIPIKALNEPVAMDGQEGSAVLDILLSLFKAEHELLKAEMESHLPTPSGKPIGRPTKMNDKREKLGRAALREGRRGDEVWKMLQQVRGPKLARSTYYNWQKKQLASIEDS